MATCSTSFGCLRSLGSLQMDHESVFGSSSKGAQLLVSSGPKTGPPPSRKVVLLDRACSLGRDAHGAVREEEDTRLASQMSQINPGDQWDDRCCSQIIVTTKKVPIFMVTSPTVIANLLVRVTIELFQDAYTTLTNAFVKTFVLLEGMEKN